MNMCIILTFDLISKQTKTVDRSTRSKKRKYTTLERQISPVHVCHGCYSKIEICMLFSNSIITIPTTLGNQKHIFVKHESLMYCVVKVVHLCLMLDTKKFPHRDNYLSENDCVLRSEEQ